MDRFGIGNMIRGAVKCLLISGRQSGKTTELVQSLKDGDRVVFTGEGEAARVTRLAKELGIEIDVSVIPPNQPERLSDKGTPKGNLILDHEWVEQYYLNAIERAQRDIDYFQRELSGQGMAHIETRMAAREKDRWHPFFDA